VKIVLLVSYSIGMRGADATRCFLLQASGPLCRCSWRDFYTAEESAMASSLNDSPAARSNGRAPRRLVLLAEGEDSAVASVLAEYPGEEARRLHEQMPQLAAQHPGRVVAAEWLGPRGWTRFLTCRK
jgi:hypothetical protein